jgi:iron(III) transport system permease protein
MKQTEAKITTAVSQRMSTLSTWRANGIRLWLPIIVLGSLLSLLVIPPISMLVQMSFTEVNPDGSAGAFTLANFRKIIQSANLYSSLWHSLSFAALSAVVSLLCGGMLAWIVERSNAPFRPLAQMTVILSMGMPHIVSVSAWLFLLGPVGPFNVLYNMFYGYFIGGKDLFFNVYSIWGMVLIEGFLWSPLAFLLLSATLRRSNAEMEEAGRMSGASVFNTIRRISLPLTLPAVLGLALFVFIRCLEAFEVPVLIGMPGRINLLTTDVYLNMTRVPPQMGHASAFSLILIALLAVLLHFYNRISQNADQYASITGKGYRPRPFDLGTARWVGGAIVLAYFAFVIVLPLIAILWTSLMPFARPIGLASVRLLTFDNFAAILNDFSRLKLAMNTIFVSAIAATLAMLISLFTGWLSVRRWPGGRVLEQLAIVPLVFPGIVLGVSMIEISLRTPIMLYGTYWIISIAYLIRYLPYGMRYTSSGILQVHRELEEGAGVSGASQLTILRRIVVPLISPSLIAGWLFIFLLGAKELSMALLLSGPRTQTMAVAMYDLMANGQAGEVSALGVVWTLVMTVCTSALFFFTRRQTSIVVDA